jgi:hypothetical protein
MMHDLKTDYFVIFLKGEQAQATEVIFSRLFFEFEYNEKKYHYKNFHDFINDGFVFDSLNTTSFIETIQVSKPKKYTRLQKLIVKLFKL